MTDKPSDESYDWVDDDSMSIEETLRRFDALESEILVDSNGNIFLDCLFVPIDD